MPHQQGECFEDDPHMVKQDVCLNCAWFRIQQFGQSQSKTFSFEEDPNQCLKALRAWTKSRENRGAIGFTGLLNMLKGMKFREMRVDEKKDRNLPAEYTVQLIHNSGQVFDGKENSVSDAIGEAVNKYVDRLVGVVT